jgi:xylan 1,4-beta-xylosidase
VGIISLRADWQTHAKIANRELGMLRVRGHGALSDDKDSMAILKWSARRAHLQLDELRQVPGRHRRGEHAPADGADFMPKDLAKNGDSRDAPKDLNVWKQFMQALVQHCVAKFGADDVGKWYWEVWNEPDYAGFWNGSDKNESLSQKMTGVLRALRRDRRRRHRRAAQHPDWRSVDDEPARSPRSCSTARARASA